MHRTSRLLLAAATLSVLAAGCQNNSSTPHAVGGAGPAGAATSTPGAAAGGGTAPAGGDDSTAFCALARQKGAENLLVLRDGSSTDGPDFTQALANLDALTAAAPSDLKADFTRFDQLEHALFGGHPDPQTVAEADSPDTVASLEHIQTYLADTCGMTG